MKEVEVKFDADVYKEYTKLQELVTQGKQSCNAFIIAS